MRCHGCVRSANHGKAGRDTARSVSLALRPVNGNETLVLNRSPAANADVIVTSGSYADGTLDQCLVSSPVK